jgi:long-subunit acyl-CoA synthetase (AMP-forming)
MFGMTFTDWSGVPEDVAAARAEIEAEIAGSTLLTEFAETVAQAPDAVAHRWQADGEWRSLTYPQLYDQVRDAALGLAATGLRPGEFAAVWSRNRSEATIADYAVMHARGVPVFIYPTVAPEQAADIIGHCEATVVIVEREFLPVLDSVQDRLPQLRAVVVLGDEIGRDVTHDGEEASRGGHYRGRPRRSAGRRCSTSATQRRSSIPARSSAAGGR